MNMIIFSSTATIFCFKESSNKPIPQFNDKIFEFSDNKERIVSSFIFPFEDKQGIQILSNINTSDQKTGMANKIVHKPFYILAFQIADNVLC